MPKVVNEGHTEHTVEKYRREKLPNGDDVLREQFTKTYVFKPAPARGNPEEVDVPKEDLDKMLNKEDYTKCRIYTKAQHNKRMKLIGEQIELEDELLTLKEGDEKRQEEIYEALLINDRERYLIQTDLPHVI